MTACTTTNCKAILPPYPKAGAEVAKELEAVCFVEEKVITEDGEMTTKLVNKKCPKLFAWLDDIKKLAQKLNKENYEISTWDKIKDFFN